MIKVVKSENAQKSVELYEELMNLLNSNNSKEEARKDYVLDGGKYKAVYYNKEAFDKEFPESKTTDEDNWAISPVEEKKKGKKLLGMAILGTLAVAGVVYLIKG